jgi:hypothetical protein
MCRGRRARIVLSLTHTQTGTQGALVQYKDWAGWAVLCVVSFYSQHTVDLFEDGSEARVQGKEASLTHTNGRALEYRTITGWLRCAGDLFGNGSEAHVYGKEAGAPSDQNMPLENRRAEG